MTTPEEFIKNVSDEDTFLKFIKLLSDDWYKHDEIEKRQPSKYSQGALGWENASIGDFLESASAFGEVTLSQKNNHSDNPWRRAAEIVFAGKHYE